MSKTVEEERKKRLILYKVILYKAYMYDTPSLIKR